MRARIAALMVVVCLFAALIAAQTGQPGNTQQGSNGVIAGTVRHVSGAVLPRVRIVASGPSPSLEQRTAVTDDRGAFAIGSMRPGTYRLEFVLDGFVTHVRQDVIVAAGGKATLTIRMRPGSVADVDVSFERAPLSPVQIVPPPPPSAAGSPVRQHRLWSGTRRFGAESRVESWAECRRSSGRSGRRSGRWTA